MRVAVFCEKSGIVREAFRKRGHNAWSFDLQRSDDNSPFHVVGDCTPYINAGWDLAICHPPCTFICNSGVRWLAGNNERWVQLWHAVQFFKQFIDAPIPRKIIENPIPHRHTFGLPRYSQIIHPWQFGHPERKSTCLWLTGLPLLRPTANVKAVMDYLPKRETDRIHYASPSANRGDIRSVTYTGIANAFTEQYG